MSVHHHADHAHDHHAHSHHGHDHHAHSHHGHSHHAHAAVPTTPEQVRALRIALVLVSCFSMAELWVSLQSNSLSLMADAGHMMADVFAIAFALWIASRTLFSVAAEAVDAAGSERLNAIAALINGGLLIAMSGWIGWEALGELRVPPTEILSQPVAMTAAVGLGVNGLNAYLLHAHTEDNLNLRAAFLHMLADAGSCLGVLVGALLMANFGWYWADGLVSSAIALLIASIAVPLLRQSWVTLSASVAETSAEISAEPEESRAL